MVYDTHYHFSWTLCVGYPWSLTILFYLRISPAEYAESIGVLCGHTEVRHALTFLRLTAVFV